MLPCEAGQPAAVEERLPLPRPCPLLSTAERRLQPACMLLVQANVDFAEEEGHTEEDEEEDFMRSRERTQILQSL